MRKKGIIIQGSARSDGNTFKIVSLFKEKTGFDSIDLRTKNIAEYDYEFKNQGDDFIGIMRDIVSNYDTIIFATPVYWYTMSGVMKTFFDRISDCLKIEKELGRKLRGMNMGMISIGSYGELVNGFSMPFVESANYLGMHYVGDVHTWIEDIAIPNEVIILIENYAKKLMAA
jgi:multimeric flavodoxin WrbA